MSKSFRLIPLQKVTVFTITEIMATTLKREFTIIGEDENGYFGTPRFNKNALYINKNHQKDMLLFDGWNLPIIADTETEVYNGNAAFNLVAFSKDIVLREIKINLINGLTDHYKERIYFIPADNPSEAPTPIYNHL